MEVVSNPGDPAMQAVSAPLPESSKPAGADAKVVMSDDGSMATVTLSHEIQVMADRTNVITIKKPNAGDVIKAGGAMPLKLIPREDGSMDREVDYAAAVKLAGVCCPIQADGLNQVSVGDMLIIGWVMAGFSIDGLVSG